MSLEISTDEIKLLFESIGNKMNVGTSVSTPAANLTTKHLELLIKSLIEKASILASEDNSSFVSAAHVKRCIPSVFMEFL
eukprot:TRINITY_DN11665_c0_g1_i1.p1 TRINITY_DN11665_c0_g1~~TRINITY_DN11665_c0_g1_i1.p1  ORF type:complete len:80 (+),score=27.01 TRINITY_DN11665_c0_g1_i1:51-290(+)